MEILDIILTSIFMITVIVKVGILLTRNSIEKRKNNPLIIYITNDILNLCILLFIILLIIFYFMNR